MYTDWKTCSKNVNSGFPGEVLHCIGETLHLVLFHNFFVIGMYYFQ